MLDDVQRRVLDAALAMQRQSWEQGVLSHALLDLGEHRLAGLLAHAAVTRQTAAGKLGEIEDGGVVNAAANGEAAGAAGFTSALDRQLAYLDARAPRADDGTLFHLEGSREVWVDTVYMVVPLLVLTGRVGDAATQLAGHRRRLFDARAQLYAHRWDEDAGHLARPAFWGSGNGWVAAGLARALRHLARGRPVTGAGRAEAEQFRGAAADHARAVIDACLRYRTPSGLFRDVLDDGATFEEVTLAQMLAYATLTGVADGWLPARYAATGRALLATAREHVDADGLLTPACGSPRFDRAGVSTESQAFFLLATAAERTCP